MKKFWKQDGDDYVLHFEPFYEDVILAVLYKDEDGDWYFRCDLIGTVSDYCLGSCLCLHDVKLEVEERISDHYEGQRDYYQSLLDDFNDNN